MAATTSTLTTPAERITAEGGLSAPAVARRLPRLRGDRPTHPSTIGRWATRGVRLPDGSRLKLEAIRIGGKLVTSWPAVVRFLDAQQQTPPADGNALEHRTPAARNKAAEAAARELELLGA